MDTFWKDLGLEDNPYDSRPLVISKNDRKLFVGRKNELAALNTLVSSPKGGIVIVEGEVGVGKTKPLLTYFNMKNGQRTNSCHLLKKWRLRKI